MITVKEKWESNSDTSIQLLSDNNKKREKKREEANKLKKMSKIKGDGDDKCRRGGLAGAAHGAGANR